MGAKLFQQLFLKSTYKLSLSIKSRDSFLPNFITMTPIEFYPPMNLVSLNNSYPKQKAFGKRKQSTQIEEGTGQFGSLVNSLLTKIKHVSLLQDFPEPLLLCNITLEKKGVVCGDSQAYFMGELFFISCTANQPSARKVCSEEHTLRTTNQKKVLMKPQKQI